MSDENSNSRKIELEALYGDIILEHHEDPRNFGILDPCDCREEGYNPLCGDQVLLTLRLKPHAEGEPLAIGQIQFEGRGCSISMASHSMLTETVEGKSFSEVEALIEDFRAMMQGEAPKLIDGDLLALQGVQRFPVRIKCALLSWMTLKKMLDTVREKNKVVSQEEFLEWLKPVQDPELHMGLVDLGLIYEVKASPHDSTDVHAKMTLTSPGCPAAGYLVDQVKNRLLEKPGVKSAQVEIVFDPKWDPKVMASEEVREKLGLW